MRRSFVTLDVFTDRRFAGNPLAVVLDADGLETAGDAGGRARVQPSGDGVRVPPGRSGAPRARSHLHAGARAAVRRPSDGGDRGAARAARRRRRRPRDRAGRADRPGALHARGERRRAGGARFAVPQLPAEVGPAPDDRDDRRGARARAATSASATSARRAGPPAIPSPSCRLPALPRSRAAVLIPPGSTPPSARVARSMSSAAETREPGHGFHARMFAPGLGIPEDPATGSAAAAFTGVLADAACPTATMRSPSSRATRWAARA